MSQHEDVVESQGMSRVQLQPHEIYQIMKLATKGAPENFQRTAPTIQPRP